MKTTLLRPGGIAAALLAVGGSAAAESATMGWQAVPHEASYATQPRMTGPVARNKYPEKKGVFKGEFLSAWGCQLIAVHKLSLNQKGNLQSQRVKFTVLPVSKPEPVETKEAPGIKQTKVLFETESLSFEPGACFMLIFKTKLDSPAKVHTNMIMLNITNLFIPS